MTHHSILKQQPIFFYSLFLSKLSLKKTAHFHFFSEEKQNLNLKYKVHNIHFFELIM